MKPIDKAMLALAALTYRGISSHSVTAIKAKLDPWLQELPPGAGLWELAWGPAVFRAPGSLVDDAMAFVVKRGSDAPDDMPDWVVAIRGTNPVSWFDWVLGDFWVHYMVPWSASTPNALISASTALGDLIIRNLTVTSEPSPSSPLGKIAAALERLPKPVDLISSKIELPELLRNPDVVNQTLIERIDSIVDAARESLEAGIIGALSKAAAHVDQAFKRTAEFLGDFALERLREEVQIARETNGGETIDQFLSGKVVPGERVAVTGHSKGGAATHATALWLAEEWAPKTGAVIECFSFAGPTCGNAKFVAHYNSVLGGARTRRVVNRRDLVPHAWYPKALKKVAPSYPRLRPAIRALATSIRKRGYRHLGDKPDFDFDRGRKRTLDVAELIYQHLDAYLEEAGFPSDRWNARTIMLT